MLHVLRLDPYSIHNDVRYAERQNRHLFTTDKEGYWTKHITGLRHVSITYVFTDVVKGNSGMSTFHRKIVYGIYGNCRIWHLW